MKYVKKVYLNTEKTKYCIVELYTTRKEMRVAYNKHPSNNAKGSKILGAHCGYEKYRSTQPRWGGFTRDWYCVPFFRKLWCWCSSSRNNARSSVGMETQKIEKSIPNCNKKYQRGGEDFA